MAKSFGEYYREAQANGLIGAPRAASSPDVFGNLEAVKGVGGDEAFSPLTPVKWAIDIISRPEYAVTGALAGIGKAHQAFKEGKTEGTFFDYLGQAIEGGAKGLTSTNPEDQYTGSELLENAGVAEDVTKGVGGFALDIALDPLTYATGGLAKLASKGAGVVTKGLDSATKGAKAAEPIASVAEKAARAGDRVAVARSDEFDEALADDMLSLEVPKLREQPAAVSRAPEAPTPTVSVARGTADEGFESPLKVLFLDDAGKLASQPAATREQAEQFAKILREQYGAKAIPANAKLGRSRNSYQIVEGADVRPYAPELSEGAGRQLTDDVTAAIPDVGAADRASVAEQILKGVPASRQAPPTRAEDLAQLRGVAGSVQQAPVFQRALPVLEGIRKVKETGFVTRPETRGARVGMIRDWLKQTDPATPLAYRPGLPERPLSEWVQRRAAAAERFKAGSEDAREIFQEADEVVQKAFDASELGQVYRDSLKGENVFSDINTYADAIRNMRDGMETLTDVLPSNVSTLLLRNLEGNPERFEKLMNDMLSALGSRPSARRFLGMDNQLRIRMMNAAGLDVVTRSDALSTVARVIRADAETQTGRRLGSTANNIWRGWATTHLKKAKSFQYETLSGAKTNVPAKGKGQALYADEINAYGQYDRARRVNQYYLKPGARGEKEFLDFVYRRRLDAAGGNTRAIGVSRPTSSRKIYGEERAQAILEFKIMKYRELDEIDDFYGFRSQLEIGPSKRAAALDGGFEDRIPLSIGDVYEVLYKSAMGSPLQNAMLRTIGNFETSVAPSQLLQAVASRFRGESDEAFDAIAGATTTRSGEKEMANNIVGESRTGMVHYLPKQRAQAAEAARAAGGELKYTGPKDKPTGYFVQYPAEMLLWELRQVVDQAMPLLRATAGENASRFAAKGADEVDYLSSSMLKELDDVVTNGSDGDLVEAIIKRRADAETLANRHQTFLASKQAAIDVQEGLVSLGGRDLIPPANRLNIVDAAIDKHLYPTLLDAQRKSNAFGLTGKHGGNRVASTFVRPADAEVKTAIKHLADEGDTAAKQRWEIISRSGRIANKDRHNGAFVSRATKIRDERAAKQAVAAAQKPLSDAEVRQAAKIRKGQAEYADRVTRQQHIKEDEDVLAVVQAEQQAASEAWLARATAAADDMDEVTATQILEENAEILDLLNRASNVRTDQTTGRLLDAFGRRFIKDHDMATLYPFVFKESQLAGQYVTAMKRKLMETAALVGVTRSSAVRGSVLPVAFANLQRGLPGGELQAIQDGFEDVLRTVLPTDDTNWMSSTFFRNSQKVDELNEMLRANGLKPSDIGKADGGAFDWEEAVRLAGERGTQPADELMDQWRKWQVDDPVTTLNKIVQAAGDLNQRKAIAADFHVLAEKGDWVRDTAEPGYVRITATGKGSTFGGFIDSEKFYKREFAKELQRADEFMREPRQLQNEWLRKYYVPTLQTWKWSITLPRPGHHIRNMIGDWSIQTVARGVRSFAIAQQDAIKILGTNAKYDGADILAALERRPGDPLPKGGDVLVRSDKYGDFTVDELFAALNDQGLRPTYHASEGLFGDEVTQNTYSMILDKATIIKETRLGEKIGQFSEYRDHYARAGHFMQALRQEVAKGKYKTRDELVAALGAEVRKYHPDATMLTPFEARYMRNIIPFYSWFRGVLPAIVESSARHPNRVMWFPKASYNLAVTQGIDPESFSNPFPDDQMFPDFIASQVTGPQFQLPGGTYISMNPGIAHLDVFNTLGGGTPEGILRGVAGMVSPLIRVPAEILGNSRWSTGQPIRDMSDYLDSTIPGINYLANVTGVSPTGSVAGILSGQGLDAQEQVTRGVKEPLDQGISAFNWLSGLGAQNLSRENYQTIAEIQKRDRALEDYKRSQ